MRLASFWAAMFLSVGLLAAPVPAWACRTAVPAITGDFYTIVMVEILRTRQVTEPGWWTWDVEARVEQVIAGHPDAETYSFRHTTGSNGCSRQTPAGRWVLYVQDAVEGQRVVEALPLAEALQLDPRVTTVAQTEPAALLGADAFWAIIDGTAVFEANPERQVEVLRADLEKLSTDELVAFTNTFEQQLRRAYRWDVWAVAYIAHGGASDDGFEYFRRWLVSKGRSVFEQVLTDPDSLAVLLAPGAEGVMEFEEITYVSWDVWGAKTGLEPNAIPMSTDFMTLGVEPDGEPFPNDPEQLARAYPRMWARFGESPLGY